MTKIQPLNSHIDQTRKSTPTLIGMLLLSGCLFQLMFRHALRGFQHGFGKNAVPNGGILHQHMSDRPHQFAVLHNG